MSELPLEFGRSLRGCKTKDFGVSNRGAYFKPWNKKCFLCLHISTALIVTTGRVILHFIDPCSTCICTSYILECCRGIAFEDKLQKRIPLKFMTLDPKHIAMIAHFRY